LVLAIIAAWLVIEIMKIGMAPAVESFPAQQSTLTATSLFSETVGPSPQSRATRTILPSGHPTPTGIPTRELAFVQQVIDGDSIKVVVDGSEYDLRYIGIDSPEAGMPLSKDATLENMRLVESQIVELEHDISKVDQYGRLLRYVYLLDGTLVNAELVRLGLAVAHAYPPDTKYQALLESTEMIAKDAGIGIWAPLPEPTSTNNPESKDYLHIDPACSQFNAPGNDNENKNEEYVCVVNSGAVNVDMQGWKIHDDYGWTFQFPSYILESRAQVQIFTGCGTDTTTKLYWCKDETAVWNNDGDCVLLKDVDGELAAEYCY
jgi:endonuclease YncB( thermonuclease family)